MDSIVPPWIGFEIEVGNHLAGSESKDSDLKAARALSAAFAKRFARLPSVDEETGCGVEEFARTGDRGYVDHRHFEFSSSLACSARDLVYQHRKARRILEICKADAEKNGAPICVHLNNTNRQGACWGFHLNVLVGRDIFESWRESNWEPLFSQWIPFLVTSPALFGSGKTVSEKDDSCEGFQLSQRAEFINRNLGLETVASKSLHNLRDEALADPNRFARLHIIAFDTNQLEFANWLKFGCVQVLLSVIQEDWPLPDLTLDDAVVSIHEVSQDLSLREKLDMANGRKLSALEIQKKLALAVSAAVRHGAASCVPDAGLLCRYWLDSTDRLEKGDPALASRLDWVAKRRFLECFPAGSHPVASDLRFAEVGPNDTLRSLSRARLVERLEDFLPSSSLSQPQRQNTRECARKLLLRRFGPEALEVGWTRCFFSKSPQSAWEVPLEDVIDSGPLLDSIESSESLEDFLHHVSRAGLAREAAVVEVILHPDEIQKEPENASPIEEKEKSSRLE